MTATGKCPGCGQEGELGERCSQHEGFCFADPSQLDTNTDEEVLLGRMVAQRFAPFRVLGKGGMGWVFEALQFPFRRPVALKILRSDCMSDELVRKRFFREAEVLGQLKHENLVTLYDAGEIEEKGREYLFIAMELLRGRTLTRVMSLPGFLHAQRLIAIACGIADGIAEAHDHGVVHRDLKPENIMIEQDAKKRELVKVLDFGIARMQTADTVLTRTGMVFGTPSYMSPEQATGDPEIGPAADIYAFGVLLYQMLTGRLPFDAKSALQILMAHVNVPPPKIVLRTGLEVPGSLLDMTYHCLEKKPSQRLEDGRALSKRLHEIATHLAEGRNLISHATGEGAGAISPNSSAASPFEAFDGGTEPENAHLTLDESPASSDSLDTATRPELPGVKSGTPEISIPTSLLHGPQDTDEDVSSALDEPDGPKAAREDGHSTDLVTFGKHEATELGIGSGARLKQAPQNGIWLWLAVGAAVLALIVGVALLLGKGESEASKVEDSREEDPTPPEGVDADPPEPLSRGSGGRESRVDKTHPNPSELIERADVDETGANREAVRIEELIRELQKLQTDETMLMTAIDVDPEDRERRGRALGLAIEAVQRELRELGVEPDEL